MSRTIDAGLVTAYGYAVDAGYTGTKEEFAEDLSSIPSLRNRIAAIEEADGVHRYGVSGLLNSSPTLTRLYDSVGMTAQVGTDGDNSNVINNFDNVTPFNRRKCVGKWNNILGKAVFEVNAYLGDDDYAEDGSMGDYVAVECPAAYFKMTGTELVISAHRYAGYRPFDIFCQNHDPNEVLPVYYLPAYALALKDGHAVSLPGYDNEQGDYKTLVDAARTYGDGTFEEFAMLQPAAVNFYEWALFTVEFATNNCQSIMQGCASLRSADADRMTCKDATHFITNDYQAARVAGEYIAITAAGTSHASVAYKATHKITAIIRCDENGNASASGTHQLLTVEDLGKDYVTYTAGTAYSLAARPYRTGSCNEVSTPSGSPVSNTNGYYPMKYRWRENVFGNQYKTSMDLFNMRAGTGENDYFLAWYYLPDPTKYTPSATSKPDATDLASDLFVKLDVETKHENYANGYIKSKKYSAEFPDIWIPYETTGASASSYFCDYAYLVHSSVVRAVRFGGFWSLGAYAGFSIANAYTAPSYAYAYYGGDLFFAQ